MGYNLCLIKTCKLFVRCSAEFYIDIKGNEYRLTGLSVQFATFDFGKLNIDFKQVLILFQMKYYEGC